MVENQYTYAVARIRSKELSLLDKPFFDQLLACKTHKDCLRLLVEKGWGTSGEESAEQILTIEEEKIWDTIKELVDDMSIFDTFLIGNDYHNLKAAIKEIYINEEVPNIYISRGTIDVALIYKAIKEHDFSLLPEKMRQCAQEAFEVQLHTGDGQLCNVIIDKASLEASYEKGKNSNSELFEKYVELKIAACDINIALRSSKTKKSMEFLKRALAKCDSLDIDKLAAATLEGKEAIFEYLENTVYSDAVNAIKESSTSFDKWCDNLIINHIKPQKYNSFTISPLAAYILARENEIKSVRVLLSGKHNNIPEDTIRERLRETYV
jgi:V/A-type H+/Na+-transporting ATPase subunit C